jgi:hypothetical protein
VEQEGVSKEKGIFAATPPMSITIARARMRSTLATDGQCHAGRWSTPFA